MAVMPSKKLVIATQVYGGIRIRLDARTCSSSFASSSSGPESKALVDRFNGEITGIHDIAKRYFTIANLFSGSQNLLDGGQRSGNNHNRGIQCGIDRLSDVDLFLARQQIAAPGQIQGSTEKRGRCDAKPGFA